MSMICEMRQLSPAYSQKLLHNPDEVLQYYDDASEGELPEEAQGEGLDLDNYVLTGTTEQGEEPWCYLQMGGKQVGDEETHDVGYGPARILLPAQVAAFYEVIATLNPTEISARFNPAEMTRLDIYPSVWNRQDEQIGEWLQESMADLLAFLKRASEKGQAVILAVM